MMQFGVISLFVSFASDLSIISCFTFVLKTLKKCLFYCKPKLLGPELLISGLLQGYMSKVTLYGPRQVIGLWLCRPGLCCLVQERRPSAAGGNEGRDGHVYHQGCAARRRELRLCRRNQEEDQRPGQPAAAVQPLGGKNPDPHSCLLIHGLPVGDTGRTHSSPCAQSGGQGKAVSEGALVPNTSSATYCTVCASSLSWFRPCDKACGYLASGPHWFVGVFLFSVPLHSGLLSAVWPCARLHTSLSFNSI